MGNEGIMYHITTVSSLIIFKLSVLVVGYLIAKLGYELLVKGVTGEFKFKTKFKDSTVDLVSASPGLFFILMATILISIGILKDKPFETKVTTKSVEQQIQSGSGYVKDKLQKPPTPIRHKE